MYSTKALDRLCGHNFLQRDKKMTFWSIIFIPIIIIIMADNLMSISFSLCELKSVNPPEKILNKFIQLWHYS